MGNFCKRKREKEEIRLIDYYYKKEEGVWHLLCVSAHFELVVVSECVCVYALEMGSGKELADGGKVVILEACFLP